ncbi:MAG: alpha/beta fold hydrolase [Ilumatobacteraceae bacterium]
MRAGTRVLLAAALLAVAGCSSGAGVTATARDAGGDAAPDTSDGGQLVDSMEWGPCTDDAVTDDTLECGTLTVPLDHSNPGGDTIDLALVRVPATDRREGAVLMNPGGPGGSGFDLVAYSGTVVQSQLGLGAFDIVGFDPRGVDRSNGIRCVDDAFTDRHLYLDDTPDTPEEEQLLAESDRGFVDGCTQKYGDTLRFYSTEATARDMDEIRDAMGDDQISYLGISYGTYLGAVYATLFPDRVRAMALDSAYEPNGDSVDEQYLTQIVGFETAFDDWRSWCEGTDECAFRTADVGKRWDTLRTMLDESPLADADGRPINQATMDTATQAALYSESDWPVLGAALANAERGDGSGLLSLADAYSGRNADGTFDTLFQSLTVIQCASGIEQQPPDDPEALLVTIKRQAPRFGADLTVDDFSESSECADLMPSQQPTEIAYEGDAPIVVIGGTKDPATPIRWAKEMTAALGPNARMVTFTGEGHGQLLVSTCVTDIEAAVLADRTLPDPDTTCDPDPAVERPSWWGDLPVPTGHTLQDIPAVKAALGLTDGLGYGQTWVTDEARDVADQAWADAMTDAGYRDLGSQDLGLKDVLERGYMSRDGDLVVVITLGASAFDSDELVAAKGAVPPGKTIVMVAYLPQ